MSLFGILLNATCARLQHCLNFLSKILRSNFKSSSHSNFKFFYLLKLQFSLSKLIKIEELTFIPNFLILSTSLLFAKSISSFNLFNSGFLSSSYWYLLLIFLYNSSFYLFLNSGNFT